MPFSLPLLEWIDIPAGEVIADSVGTYDIAAFKIAKYPVTNEQFAEFIQDGGYKNASWWAGLAFTGGSPLASDWKEPACPKLEVTWFEAVTFCRWLTDQLDLPVRLPTEWEWQWAAVGGSGWAYPYGDVFDSAACNTKESSLARTNAVTTYADMKTHFGTVDMSGNVWEWCLNEGEAPFSTGISGTSNRALRGGSWNNPAKNAAVTSRASRTPRTRTFNIGFRVIIAE